MSRISLIGSANRRSHSGGPTPSVPTGIRRSSMVPLRTGSRGMATPGLIPTRSTQKENYPALFASPLESERNLIRGR